MSLQKKRWESWNREPEVNAHITQNELENIYKLYFKF